MFNMRWKNKVPLNMERMSDFISSGSSKWLQIHNLKFSDMQQKVISFLVLPFNWCIITIITNRLNPWVYLSCTTCPYSHPLNPTTANWLQTCSLPYPNVLSNLSQQAPTPRRKFFVCLCMITTSRCAWPGCSTSSRHRLRKSDCAANIRTSTRYWWMRKCMHGCKNWQSNKFT